MKLIGNFWFLKSPNGMFHYGMEVLSDLGFEEIEIIFHKRIKNERLDLPAHAKVRFLGFFGFLIVYFKLLIKRSFLYSPTVHCLPFVSRQVSTLHDSYPFNKTFLNWKLNALRLLYYLSNPILCVVNRSDAFKFSCRLRTLKTIIYPNRISNSITPILNPSYGKKTVIGLFGTDSNKKNYYELFDNLDKDIVDKYCFYVYGTWNNYIKTLINQYQDFEIVFFDSTNVSIFDFISQISCALSVAKGEGFARPIAYSLISGRRIFLINSPVFKEFYSGSAIFFDNIFEVTSAIDSGMTDSQNYCPIDFQITLHNIHNDIAFGRKFLIQYYSD